MTGLDTSSEGVECKYPVLVHLNPRLCASHRPAASRKRKLDESTTTSTGPSTTSNGPTTTSNGPSKPGNALHTISWVRYVPLYYCTKIWA